MKEIQAVIRMRKMNETKRALAAAGISSITASECLGRGSGKIDYNILQGAQDGYEEAIAQLGEGSRLKAKRIITIIVPDKLKKTVVDTIIKVNQTGKSGDGKIFVMPVYDALRVRTGEIGDKVLDA